MYNVYRTVNGTVLVWYVCTLMTMCMNHVIFALHIYNEEEVISVGGQ